MALHNDGPVEAPLETLIERGVRLVRLHPGAKEPVETGWQNAAGLRTDAAYAALERGENLGAVLGNRSAGLTDVDLDAPEPEALAVMRALLPETAMRSGRVSKPESHFWYLSEGFSRNPYKDPLDGTLLVEIRGTGHQTAISGTHPTGEHIGGQWGEPAKVEHDRLLRALGVAAAAAFLARNWHRWNDQHHDLCLALAGGMAKGGYSEDETLALVGAVVERVDHEPQDRLRAVSDTFRRADDGETTSGWKRLAAIIDTEEKQATKTLRGWLNIATTDFDLTDAGNGLRFIRRHGERVRYSPQLESWFVWDGRRWAADDMLRTMEFARETAIAIKQEAVPGTDGEKAVLTWAKQSQMVPKLRAMLDAAGEATGEVKVSATALDANANLFNCQNGTLELETLALREHRPGDLITQIAACDYDSTATSETFERFLDEATSLAPEVRPFLQVCAGLTLLGRNVEEILVFLMGDAGSGKTTLMEALAAALGEYAATAEIDSFLAADRSNGGGAARPDLARLRGKRMVRASEPDPNRRLDTNKLKAITGGEKITVRHLYAAPFEMTPMFIPWIAANKAPQINAEDSGIWRRLLRVPLEKGRKKEERDASIKAELVDAARSGVAVLAWAVEGLRRYQQEGFQIPTIVLERTEELRQEFDTTTEWFDEECEFDSAYDESAGELHRDYGSWVRSRGGRAVTAHEFAAKLRERGLEQYRTKGGKRWRGIRLRHRTFELGLSRSGANGRQHEPSAFEKAIADPSVSANTEESR
jgi:putative DNA primase/helicase